jgi:glutamate synthase (NADPH/NADH) small chain
VRTGLCAHGPGRNEYGIAAYKLPEDFANREVAFILAIGGIAIEYGQRLGGNLALARLRDDFDAVFLSLGQSGVRALEMANEDGEGIENAVEYIAGLRQAEDLAALAVGRRVVVIGGGNTAIDIAVQSRRLGAEDVTIAYRRGPAQMGATGHEQEFAKSNGVRIGYWLRPKEILLADGEVRGVRFERDGQLVELPADVVFKAIGQLFDGAPLGGGEPALEGGRICVDEEMRTSLPDVWAGGDCVAGEDLTVQAVEDGKVAARAIDRYLRGK